jgi:hypothetical protein
MTHFTPRTKQALVDWLSMYWPEDRAKFQQKTKAVLYGIHFRVLADIRRGKYPGARVSA